MFGFIETDIQPNVNDQDNVETLQSYKALCKNLVKSIRMESDKVEELTRETA